jgi:hypothetical protein
MMTYLSRRRRTRELSRFDTIGNGLWALPLDFTRSELQVWSDLLGIGVDERIAYGHVFGFLPVSFVP